MHAFKVIYVTILCVVVASTTNKIGEQRLDWWENGVFYQIYPRSFKDSDGDGIGDIRGIIEKLDYLKELGISGAWLSPIFKSPMVDFGYDISDFYAVDPIFGENEDLYELFEKAKEKGIKIILDFVPNHTSDEHEWFKKSIKREKPYDDFYIWRDGKNENEDPPNNWVSAFYGSAWTYNEERKQWYYHAFAKEQPDLNYRNENLVKEMFNVLDFWLKKGAAGFRIDAIPHIFKDDQFRDEPQSGKTNDSNEYDYLLHYHTQGLPEMYEMVYKIREFVDEFQKNNGGEQPILMTEAFSNATEYPKFFKSTDGKKLGSHMPFNFALTFGLSTNSTANDIKRVIDNRIADVPEGTRLNWVIGNHDVPRVGSRLGERKIDGLLTLVMTLPGIAVTYNGEEIGMVDNRDGISYEETQDPPACSQPPTGDWKSRSRDPERTPFQWESSKYAGFMPSNSTNNRPWLPIHPNYKDVNLELQQNSQRSTFKFYKTLMELRKEETFARGSFNSSVLNENVFAYVRGLNGSDTYVVLINFGAREENIDIPPLLEGVVGQLPEKLEISAAGADTSCCAKGNTVNSDSVLLRKYDVIILKVPFNAGTSIIASFTLTIGITFILIVHFIFRV